MTTIALAHDYVTQRGGAERVALAMARAFPGAPLHTTLFHAEGTFPEFDQLDIRTSRVDRWPALRRHHRLALPFLAGAVDAHPIDADVVLASSSGWAHGFPTAGRKVVYCHAPARWLYQLDRYAGGDEAPGVRARAVRAAIGMLGPRLRRWDQRAAATADRYLVNSTVIQRAVQDVYGIDAEVLAPPPATLHPDDAREEIAGVRRPFLLCVARLLPYKNVDLVIEAVAAAGGLDLVVVGDGPERKTLEALAARAGGTHLVGKVSDAQLRWLYAQCEGLVAASYEDFGLSPLEAATFGKPTAALRDGGYLDTVVEGRTGVFFDSPTVDAVAGAIGALAERSWRALEITAHAESFSEERFATRLRDVVSEVVSHR
ncbi:glycosyltransferase [Microbacterium sp. NPDC055910]|uniref:glycosyltransferase n=1 Tax=Microbacterium sp. NPDC055910 TaxID=3345659 RepID=UPI0035D6870F